MNEGANRSRAEGRPAEIVCVWVCVGVEGEGREGEYFCAASGCPSRLCEVRRGPYSPQRTVVAGRMRSRDVTYEGVSPLVTPPDSCAIHSPNIVRTCGDHSARLACYRNR